MTSKNIDDCKFEAVELFGKEVLFCDDRIKRDSIPDGLYKFEIRHDDDCFGDEVEIGQSIYINFYGTIISAFNLIENGETYKDINENDMIYSGQDLPLESYMALYKSEIIKLKEKVISGREVVVKEQDEYIK